MSMLLYLRYIIMGLNVVSFLMCIIALVMFILRYSHALYNYLNVNSVVKSISIIWYVFLLFMLLKLIAAFSLKNLVIFLLAGVIGTLIQRFIVSWVKG